MSTHADKLRELAKNHGLGAEAVTGEYNALREQGVEGDDAIKRIEEKLGDQTGPQAEVEPTMEEPDIKAYMEEERNLADLIEKSKITVVEVKPAGEIFKAKARDPERPTLRIETENGSTLTMSRPKGMEYTGDKWTIKNKLQAHRSTMHKDSKFRAFLEKYGQWPHVGIEVETYNDKEGFGRIVV